MELISKLTVTGAANIDIGFNPYTFYTNNNNYMKIELAHDFTAQIISTSGYLYACSSNWFTFEKGRYGCYFNFANTTRVIDIRHLPNIDTTDSVTNPITVVLNNGTVTATQGSDTQTNTYSGNMPNGNVFFYPSGGANDYGGEFYGFKVYGAGDVLAHHYVGFDDGVDVGIEDLVTGDKYTPTGSNYTIDCVEYTPPTPTAGSKIYLGSTNLGTGKIRLGANDVSAIYLGSSLLYPPSSPADVNYVTITNTSQNSGTFSVYSSDSNFPNYTNLEYSLDGGTTWTTLNTVYDTVTVPSGDSILLRGTGNGEDFDNEEFTKLNFSESHTVSGNLANLVDYTAEPQIVPNYAFYKLFNNDTTLTQANLFDTDFDNGGIDAFDRIFDGCSSLNSVSITTNNWNSSKHDNWLTGAAATGTIYVNGDATNIPLNNTSGVPTGWTAVDGNMLRFTAEQANSTVGLTIPSGVNLTLYKSTDGTNFDSWDGSAVTLSNIGDTLWVYGNNQTISTYNSYTHFNMTGRIAAAGDITYLLQNGGVTTLPNDYAFYILFYGCTALTTAPDLPATTLTEHCYALMFDSCTNLTTVPTLPATTLQANCYEALFKDCTSLTTTPVLPATTLATNCYYGMFNGCTSLTTAPELPALTLVEGCYGNMFTNCSSLNSVTCLATDISATDIMGFACTNNWLGNVAATGTFTKSPNMSSWTTGTSGIPTGWTVVDAQ